jgi:hypothetical protein
MQPEFFSRADGRLAEGKEDSSLGLPETRRLESLSAAAFSIIITLLVLAWKPRSLLNFWQRS